MKTKTENGANQITLPLPASVQFALRKDIRPDPEQPRKDFNEEILKELADSIRINGVQIPLIVRPDPEKKTKYLIVEGERRWRAAENAKVDRLPIEVRELDDEQTRVLQYIAGTQRANLSQLEEANHLAKQLADRQRRQPECTLEQLADELGIKRSTAYNRMALTRLSKPVEEAFKAGKIDASKAQLISTVAPEKQKEALKTATEKDYYGETPSVRELKEELARNFQNPLKGAAFKLDDANLMPARWKITNTTNGRDVTVAPATGKEPVIPKSRKAHFISRLDDDGQGHKTTVCGVREGHDITALSAPQLLEEVGNVEARAFIEIIESKGELKVERQCGGACTDCPKRTGNLNKGQTDAGDPNVCTEPSCFKEKQRLQLKAATAKLAAEGFKILTAEESKKVFRYGDWLADAYVKISDSCFDDPKRRTYQQLLKKNAPRPIIAFQGNRPVKVWRKSEMNKALTDLGYKFSLDKEKDKDAEKRQSETLKRRQKLIVELAPKLAEGLATAKDAAAWEIANDLIEYYDDYQNDELQAVLVTKAKTPKAKVLGRFFANENNSPVDYSGNWSHKETDRWKLFGVDLKSEEKHRLKSEPPAKPKKGK